MTPHIQCLLAGMVLGILVFNIGGAEKEGEKPKVGLNIQIYVKNDECIHIHHWVILLLLLIMLISVSKLFLCEATPWIYLVAGFLIGGILQDFKYGTSIFKFNQKCITQKN